MIGEQRVGDYLVLCDRSGFVGWASDTVIEWNGLRVLKRFAEARHPQDMVRGVPDDQTVQNARPEPDDVFLSAPVTAADL